MKLNKFIDHTKLGADVSKADIDKLLAEAIKYDFKSVCVNPIWVKYAKEALVDTDVLVCTVVGFPLGTHTPLIKTQETLDAVLLGADEIDMVINIEALKSDKVEVLLEEMKGVVTAAGGRTVKVIIETCYLNNAQIIKACELALEAGADFVKTSTGFGTGGATVEHVELMKQTVGDKAEVKASGGVRTTEAAKEMIKAGATRIGTSNGVDIIENKGENKNDTNSTY